MRRLLILLLALALGWLGLAAAAQAATSTNFPSCTASSQVVTRPYPAGTTLSSRWAVRSPLAHHTYNLTGVTSRAYPAMVSPFSLGVSDPGTDICLLGGTLHGTVDPTKTWEYYHNNWNASCVTIVGVDWMQVQNVACTGIEDGIRPEETASNVNNARFSIKGTYLRNVRDDCLENDDTLGGLVKDSLFESCNTGISEKPSGSRTWQSPAGETVT